MDRKSFLARVRTSLGVDPDPLPPQPPRYVPPPAPELTERIRILCTELEAAGGFTHQVSSVQAARQKIVGLLATRRTQDLAEMRVIRGDTPAMQTLDIDAELRAAGIELTVARPTETMTHEQLRAGAFAADAGLTSVDFGVAETGTLALLAAPGQGRAVSLLPPLHIAVLDAGDVVYELAALFEQVQARGELPSALTFITGPSKTGDIEQKLTIGVHGPGELHLIVIER